MQNVVEEVKINSKVLVYVYNNENQKNSYELKYISRYYVILNEFERRFNISFSSNILYNIIKAQEYCRLKSINYKDFVKDTFNDLKVDIK